MGNEGRISEYREFLRAKSVISQPCGFTPEALNPMLFDFQADITRWAIRRGRAAIFADCGLGKTAKQLEWARAVSRHENAPVLVLAPLAVSEQTVAEGSKFGIPVTLCESMADVKPGVNVSNYEKLHHFRPEFAGIVLDESSILKAFDSKTRQAITEFSRSIRYRLACSATPAPNDHVELGNHAEFLGVMTRAEMLATFFVHDGGDTSKWRLKGHAETEFWKWLASWAVMIRKPSDLGYGDGAFILPPLRLHERIVDATTDSGMLFSVEAQTLEARRAARRDSIETRVAACAELVNNSLDQWVVWCNLNAESEALAAAIPDAVEVTGADDGEFKRRAAMAFANGSARVLVSKPLIFGFGMNWQHCSKVAFVGLSDSYEQFYQAVRRCWRFGQTRPVDCHIICAETEGAVLRNIQRKELQAQQMADGMIQHMHTINEAEIRGLARVRDEYRADRKMAVPSWLEVA
jgi:hypothetical protein